MTYDIKNARVQSSLFNTSVPADSILGISPQNISGKATTMNMNREKECRKNSELERA